MEQVLQTTVDFIGRSGTFGTLHSLVGTTVAGPLATVVPQHLNQGGFTCN